MGTKLVILQNAKEEEIKAYYILKDILFKDETTFIGDDLSKNLPDLYTNDFKIGVEVTSCEHLSQFLKETFKQAKRVSKDNVKQIITEYDKLSLKDKNLLFNNEFEKILEKKISKINDYKRCESKNLIIVSDNENKNYIRRKSLSKIYYDLVKKYNKKYDNLFLFYNDTLYLDVNYNFKKLKKIKNLNKMIKSNNYDLEK